jgi:tRNA splicing endonuclease
MAIAWDSRERLAPAELSAWTRLASQVKKTVLVCTVSPDSLLPHYLALNWWNPPLCN